MDVTSRQAANRLPPAVLALHLDHHHLSHAGSRKERADRLWHHLQTEDQPASEQSASDPGQSDTEEPDEGQSDTERSDSEGSQMSSSGTSTTQTVEDEDDSQSSGSSLYMLNPARLPRSRSPRRRSTHTRSHHGPRPPSPSLTSSDSTLSSSPSSSPRPRRRQTHRHHRRHRRNRASRTHSHRKPDGVPLANSIKRKIRGGEFVEFCDVLGSAMAAGSEASHSRRKPISPITSLEAWLQAWSIFAEVLSVARPGISPLLFRYQSFIIRSSQRFQTHAWLHYDRQFRLKLAADPSISWASVDTELVATWLSADATRSRRACFKCGSYSHYASSCTKPATESGDTSQRCPGCNKRGHLPRACPLLHPSSAQPGPSDSYPGPGRSNAFRPSSSGIPRVRDTPLPEEPCLLWNRTGSCRRGTRCPFRHACLRCDGRHPMRDCTGQSR